MKKSRKITVSFFIGYFLSFFLFSLGRGNVNVTHKLGSFYADAVVGGTVDAVFGGTVSGRRWNRWTSDCSL